jgi:hypothetical protein
VRLSLTAPNYYTQAMVPGQGYDPSHQPTQYSQAYLSQAGIAQPGAHHVAYHTIQSPPGVQHQSSHTQDGGMISQHQHQSSIASENDSAQASTLGLILPSSAQSYTSGHSPISHRAQTRLQGLTSLSPM